MGTITFISPDGESRSIRIKHGTSIMEAAIAADIPGIEAQCYGAGVCGTCHVFAEPPMRSELPDPTEWETEMLSGVPLAGEGSRLSCQIPFEDRFDGAVFRVPERQDAIG
ncbi:2Fe-2S ferredoxin [Sphingobium sp. C100]|jgi:ferredoxin, 2Fe-2S|uniref:2Fe-2S iron-sulfur cluster-binding protein n=1 Tax=Sphingobium sp. C100 TaxID=1207055 RepID=UPI0003D69426|nr:2Fe-2S iron-sulfur cluster-binding protein [Sphingobium sp. C100]ETI64250.1 2Fe-2S ferredoxin [Sphingobium sp. C100]